MSRPFEGSNITVVQFSLRVGRDHQPHSLLQKMFSSFCPLCIIFVFSSSQDDLYWRWKSVKPCTLRKIFWCVIVFTAASGTSSDWHSGWKRNLQHNQTENKRRFLQKHCEERLPPVQQRWLQLLFHVAFLKLTQYHLIIQFHEYYCQTFHCNTVLFVFSHVRQRQTMEKPLFHPGGQRCSAYLLWEWEKSHQTQRADRPKCVLCVWGTRQSVWQVRN